MLTPKELQIDDVVCYAKQVGSPFPQMRVVRKGNTGVYLRRPFIHRGEACYEEVYFPYEQNFLFQLISR